MFKKCQNIKIFWRWKVFWSPRYTCKKSLVLFYPSWVFTEPFTLEPKNRFLPWKFFIESKIFWLEKKKLPFGFKSDLNFKSNYYSNLLKIVEAAILAKKCWICTAKRYFIWFSVLNGALGSAYRASCLITFIVVLIKVQLLPQNVKLTAEITSIRQIYSKFSYFC